jgi:hypothetical protein
VYYNDKLVTSSKFQTQLSRKLQRFGTWRKNKKCSIFHDLSEYIIFSYGCKLLDWSFNNVYCQCLVLSCPLLICTVLNLSYPLLFCPVTFCSYRILPWAALFKSSHFYKTEPDMCHSFMLRIISYFLWLTIITKESPKAIVKAHHLIIFKNLIFSDNWNLSRKLYLYTSLLLCLCKFKKWRNISH